MSPKELEQLNIVQSKNPGIHPKVLKAQFVNDLLEQRIAERQLTEPQRAIIQK